MKIKILFVATTLLVASCAHIPHEGSIKQCSRSPHDAVHMFFSAVREFSFTILNALIPDESSLKKVFGNNDEHRGSETIHQVLAHPEIRGEGQSCACTLSSMTDTADPNEKIIVVKRTATVEDDVRDYRRAFRVRFEPNGNCILSITPIDSKWERVAG